MANVLPHQRHEAERMFIQPSLIEREVSG